MVEYIPKSNRLIVLGDLNDKAECMPESNFIGKLGVNNNKSRLLNVWEDTRICVCVCVYKINK